VPPTRLLTRDFALVTLATAFFMLSFGATLPVLPRYVASELGGDDLAVGIVVGAYAVSAIALRPLMGRLGDRRGRRVLMVAGSAITAVGMAAHIPADSILSLIGARLIIGAGQGAVFVGAATMVNDLAPPDRRGEAATFFSVAIYVGLGLGPFIGETLLTRASFDAVWLAVALGMVTAALVSLVLPRGLPVSDGDEPEPIPRRGIGRMLHPDGVGPGLVLFLGIVGFVGFNTFVPLYGEEIGLSDVAGVFLLYSGVVLAVRLLGRKLPDAYGPVVIGTVALSASAAGLLGVASWRSPMGLYLFTVVLAVGSSLLYPALMAAAVNSAPERERSAVVATFSLFFEFASVAGGAVLGIVASQTSYSGAFVSAACFSLVGLVVLHVYLRPRLAVGSAHV
jgi:MFS family permease